MSNNNNVTVFLAATTFSATSENAALDAIAAHLGCAVTNLHMMQVGDGARIVYRGESRKAVARIEAPDLAAFEGLRSFAVQHASGDDTGHMLSFAHLCTAAIAGEEWAIARMSDAVRRADYRFSTDVTVLRAIRATDTTRPDGAIARSFAV